MRWPPRATGRAQDTTALRHRPGCRVPCPGGRSRYGQPIVSGIPGDVVGGWPIAPAPVGAVESWISIRMHYFHGTVPIQVPSSEEYMAIALITLQATRRDEFEHCLLGWITSLQEVSVGQVIAMGGRTLRQSFDKAAATSAIPMIGAQAVADHNGLWQEGGITGRADDRGMGPRLSRARPLRGVAQGGQSPGSACLPGGGTAFWRPWIPVVGPRRQSRLSRRRGSRRSFWGTLAAFSTILASEPFAGGPGASALRKRPDKNQRPRKFFCPSGAAPPLRLWSPKTPPGRFRCVVRGGTGACVPRTRSSSSR